MAEDNNQRAGIRIIIAEDDDDSRLVLQRILDAAGYSVDVASDGEEALKKARQNPPDLFISDILMPQMDGFQLCRYIKQDEVLKDIPFIFYTATYTDSDDERLSKSMGAARYVIKPVTPDKILQIIDEVLKENAKTQAEAEVPLDGPSQLDAMYLQSVARKLNEKVRALEEEHLALQQSEEKFRRLVEGISDEYFMYSRGIDGVFTYVSPSIQQVLGYTQAEFLTHFSDYLTDNPVNEKMREYSERIGRGEKVPGYELEVYHKDGHACRLEIQNTPLLDGAGKVYAVEGIAHDITERVAAREELDRIRHLLKNVFDSMPSILVGVDSEGRVSQWNREAERVTGVDESQALGQKPAQLLPQLQAHVAYITEAMKDGKPKKLTGQLYRSGDTQTYSDIMIYPLLDNRVNGAVIRVDDVSERVRIEAMMVQTEKMVSVGGLAAGMAHEINNPLGAITMGLQNIQRRVSPGLAANKEVAERLGLDMEKLQTYVEDREILKMLNILRESASRASTIVDHMLKFSRKPEKRLELVDLEGIINSSVELARVDYDLNKRYDFRNIKIRQDCEPDLPEVPCIASELEQVILNLLRNAAQALEENIRQGAAAEIGITMRRSDDHVRIEVEDNGPGIDLDTQRQVFDHFFTTRAPGEGTGLGLSVSYFIITDTHHGRMFVESEPGKGARFIIELPTEDVAGRVTKTLST